MNQKSKPADSKRIRLQASSLKKNIQSKNTRQSCTNNGKLNKKIAFRDEKAWMQLFLIVTSGIGLLSTMAFLLSPEGDALCGYIVEPAAEGKYADSALRALGSFAEHNPPQDIFVDKVTGKVFSTKRKQSRVRERPEN